MAPSEMDVISSVRAARDLPVRSMWATACCDAVAISRDRRARDSAMLSTCPAASLEMPVRSWNWRTSPSPNSLRRRVACSATPFSSSDRALICSLTDDTCPMAFSAVTVRFSALRPSALVTRLTSLAARSTEMVTWWERSCRPSPAFSRWAAASSDADAMPATCWCSMSAKDRTWVEA